MYPKKLIRFTSESKSQVANLITDVILESSTSIIALFKQNKSMRETTNLINNQMEN